MASLVQCLRLTQGAISTFTEQSTTRSLSLTPIVISLSSGSRSNHSCNRDYSLLPLPTSTHKARFTTSIGSSSSPAEAQASTTSSASPSLEETQALPLLDENGKLRDGFPASSGVYAIFDPQGVLQFMGLSRRLSASLLTHSEELPELCGSVKVLVVEAAGKAGLVDAWQRWMQQHVDATGSVPPGNVSGNPTWTARRAKRTKADLRLTPGNNKELTVPIIELVDRVVKEFKVVAFIKGTRTSPQCGFSHRVLTLLNEAKADYETLNVLDEDSNPGLREAIKEYSQWPTIPQVFIGGEFVGGADVMDEMAQSGELKKLLSS